MKYFTKSLRFKVTFLVIAVELLVFSAVGVFYTHRFSQEIDSAIIARLSIPGLLMSRGELSFDAVSDKRTMEGLLREPYSEGIVIGLDGQVYFSSDPARLDTRLEEIDGLRLPGPGASPSSLDAPDRIAPVQDSTGTYLTCLSPLRPGGKLTGYLYLKVGTEISEAEKRKVSVLFAIGTLGTIACTVPTLSLLLHWVVIRRLNHLVEVFRRFARGDYATRAQALGEGDEIATLMHGFNNLAQRLEDTMAHLSESEGRFRVLVEHAPEAILVYDVDRMQFVDANQNAERLFACSREQLRQASSTTLYAPVHTDKVPAEEGVDESLRRTLAGEEVVVERAITNARGRRLLCEVRLVLLPAGKNRLIRASYIDITERKVAEAEIQRLNSELERRVLDRTAQLQASNRELEAFCYSVSHDLRAPLRHVDGYIELLVSRCRGDLNEQGQHYVDTIAASARHMGELIDDLLQFSRTGRVELQQEVTDMNQILQEALAPVQEAYAGRTIEWVIGELPAVRGDPALLRQVWANLLENAAKYTRSREVARIEIGAREADEEIVFVVADNGIGFDMQHAGKLFGVFQRLHSREEFEGVGIGLATVQRVVNRHGGRVWAEAELDRGARFYFTLPKYRALSS